MSRIKRYFLKFPNALENLEEMDNFLEKSNVVKLTREEIVSPNKTSIKTLN